MTPATIGRRAFSAPGHGQPDLVAANFGNDRGR
jgi:hypothetical protein